MQPIVSARVKRIAAVAMAGMAAIAGTAQGAGPDPGSGLQVPEESMARLQRGEILLESVRTDEAGGAAEVRALFHSPVERIWDVLNDCKRAAEYIDGIEACEVLAPGLEHALVSNSVKKSWVMPRLDYTVEFRRQPYTRIDFHKVNGDLKVLEGHWLFTPLPDGAGLLVTHTIRVQPRIPAPRWLIRRSVRKDIPDMLACLRSLVDGSGNEALRQSDNRRCPKAGRRQAVGFRPGPVSGPASTLASHSAGFALHSGSRGARTG